MKKIVLGIVLLTAFTSFSGYAQEKDCNFSVQIHPFKFFDKILEDEFEIEFDFYFKVHDYWNIMLRPNIAVGNFERNDISLSLMPGVIFRPFGSGLRGIYIGFYPNIGWQNVTIEKTNNNYLIVGVGAEAGFSWIFDNGFTFTLGGGAIKNRRVELNGAQRQDEEENIWQNVRFTLLLGYSF